VARAAPCHRARIAEFALAGRIAECARIKQRQSKEDLKARCDLGLGSIAGAQQLEIDFATSSQARFKVFTVGQQLLHSFFLLCLDAKLARLAALVADGDSPDRVALAVAANAAAVAVSDGSF
jgi:hypothetical protein